MNKKTIYVSLLAGLLWGLLEASLGYLLHLIPIPGIAGLIMFPIGFYFMKLAFSASNEPLSIFYTASVAASVKLIDLILPNISVIKVINPSVAILLEASVVFVYLYYVLPSRNTVTIYEPMIISAMWRVMFVVYSGTVSSHTILSNGLFVASKFLIFDSMINGSLIFLFLKFDWEASSQTLKKFFKCHF
jgi:hypothetical protein